MARNEEEARTIKQFLQFIKIARRSKPWLCTALLTGPELRKLSADVELIAEWTKEDEEAMLHLAKEFSKKTEGHTFQEMSDNLKKLLGTNGSVGTQLETIGKKTKNNKKKGSGV